MNRQRLEYEEVDRNGMPVHYVAEFLIGIVFVVHSVQFIDGKPYLKSYLTRKGTYREVRS